MRKSRQTFYSSPEVTRHLQSIPVRLRSHWVDDVLGKAIASSDSSQKDGELNQFRDWLKKREDAGDSLSKLSGFLSELFDEFIVAIKTGTEVLES